MTTKKGIKLIAFFRNRSETNNIEKGSKTGVTNGFSVVLDVENYNVGYDKTNSQGAKIAVHDYR